MPKYLLVRAAMVGALLLGAGGVAACDNEDQRDIQEIGEEADKELDKLDNDGKDD